MYEFLYRAISDYVDLYNSKDAEYEYSVPVGAVQANGTTKVRDYEDTLELGTVLKLSVLQSAKSIQSTKSLKSNGSGPYCVPVGCNGTATSKSSGTASSSASGS